MDIYSYAPKWRDIVKSKTSMFEDVEGDFSNFKIVVHNATWCPDCERETIELLAFVEALKERSPALEVVSYEDIADYKEKKSQQLLPIKCLPTIIFYSDELEIGRIEEESAPDFKSLALQFLSNK